MFNKITLITILSLALLGTGFAQDKKTEKKRYHGTIEKVSNDAITITTKNSEKVELSIGERSWLRCEYEIKKDKLNNGMQICVFGKPDKKAMTVKGSKAFVMMNEDSHYGWATKGPLVLDGGKAFMEIDGKAYEIEIGNKDLQARYQIEPKHLKPGQSVSLRANVSANEKVIDYLTVDANVMEEKAPAENKSTDETSGEENVSITLTPVNTGVNQ